VLTGNTPTHPARFSKAVLAVLEPLIDHYNLPVHDPFAGTGERLARLCDGIMVDFTGTDIERWEGQDPRVRLGNSTSKATYPREPFIVVTSPVYFANRISSDYVEGPLPTTKTSGRHAYGVSLGRPLAPDNMARVCRPAQGSEHDAVALACMQWWPERAIVNVDAPLASRWKRLAWEAGYVATQEIPAKTRRLSGGLTGAKKRAPNELVLVLRRRHRQP
jgi:hypothetical protein